MAGGLPHPLLIMTELNNALGTHIPNHVWYTWFGMSVLFVLGFIVSRRLSLVPGGVQNLAEIVIGGLEDLSSVTSVRADAKYFLSCVLFLYTSSH